MASRVFVDTGAWYALLVAKDKHHKRARAWIEDNENARLITSDYVAAEVLNLLVARQQGRICAVFAKTFLGNGGADLLLVSPADFDAALGVLTSYQDKNWSFTDCTSKVLMEQLGIDTAFAFDEHFRQFGSVTVVP